MPFGGSRNAKTARKQSVTDGQTDQLSIYIEIDIGATFDLAKQKKRNQD